MYGGWSEWGNTGPLFGTSNGATQKNIKIQYMVAIIGRQSANQNTTTNQKQATVAEGSMEGIFEERDAWGKRNAIILGML